MTEYEKGWLDAHNSIADYIEAELCAVTAEMIRRMKNEKWRTGVVYEKDSNSIHINSDTSAS